MYILDRLIITKKKIKKIRYFHSDIICQCSVMFFMRQFILYKIVPLFRSTLLIELKRIFMYKQYKIGYGQPNIEYALNIDQCTADILHLFLCEVRRLWHRNNRPRQKGTR